jgi:DNA polymerase
MISALQRYLEELRDSGVDGLPRLASAKAKPMGAIDTTDEKHGVERVTQSAGPESETLAEIRGEADGCRLCSLCGTRTNVVFGTGNPRSRIVFVGEAPGRDEDLEGEPFVGEAGQLLTKIIQAMGFSREEVYICNVLKCRPPENRNPLPREIEACQHYLLRQLKVIQPDVIVALGTFAAQALLATRQPISRLRGMFHDFHGIPLMPTFHPAYLLRNPGMKREVWEDMKAVMKKIGIAPPEKPTPGDRR